MYSDNMTLGDWIKGQRHNMGLTQAALADRLGVTRRTVAYWESDDKRPNTPTLRLFHVLVENHRLDKIFLRSTQPPPS